MKVFQIQVGKYYKNQIGYRIRIVRLVDPVIDTYNYNLGYRFIDHNGTRYTEQGNVCPVGELVDYTAWMYQLVKEHKRMTSQYWIMKIWTTVFGPKRFYM